MNGIGFCIIIIYTVFTLNRLYFVSEHAGALVSDLLSFWTSYQKIAAAHQGLTLLFPDNKANFPLPVANTCFNQLTIPTQYESFADFATKMDIALKYGSKGFSEL